MKFKYSNTEIEKDGQTYNYCDNCGIPCKSNKGFEMVAESPNISFRRRMCLCIPCANRIVPRIHKSMGEILESERRR